MKVHRTRDPGNRDEEEEAEGDDDGEGDHREEDRDEALKKGEDVLREGERRVGNAGELRGILRPAHPELKSRGEVVAAVEALRDTGITDVAFYNYGHVRSASLGWIADALSVLGD